MSTPFETLGLRAWADPDEIRSAYRALVKKCHPDMVQDPAEKKLAQERMVRLNLAYEEALRLASPRQNASWQQELPCEDAVLLAKKFLARGNPENALRQLSRAETKNALWYAVQGKILLAMGESDSAHQSFREAVRRDPENNEFRAGALDAALAMKREKTIPGKLKKVLKNLKSKK